MLLRIAKLLRIFPTSPEDSSGLLSAHGDTVPADGSSGYATGCVFAHTDGGAGTAAYINEGTATSSNFDALSSITAAQEALLSAVPGTAEASKAVILDASLDITGLNDVGISGTLTAALLGLISQARTATPTGATTGTIADKGMLQVVVVTAGGDANSIIVLPTPTPGTIVVLIHGATGFELRSSSPTTIGINGGTGADVESAVPANTTAILICESATAWKGLMIHGTAGTLAKVEVAA